MSYDEEEGPCIHHRSAFDTIPAPPVFAVRAGHDCRPQPEFAAPAPILPPPPGAEPVFVLSRYGRERRRSSEPTMLSFSAGEVAIPKPTREELLLSAEQWTTAVRDYWQDFYRTGDRSIDNRFEGYLDRLAIALKELAKT